MSVTEYPIDVQQVCIGLFVRLDEHADEQDIVRWPFPRKALKITDEGMINALRVSGVKQLLFVLNKSDTNPLPLDVAEDLSIPALPTESAPPPKGQPAAALPQIDPSLRTPVSYELQMLKRETVERNRERRTRYTKCETAYGKSVNQVAALIRRVSGRSSEAAGEVSEVVESLASTFLSERDVLVNVITSKPPEERQHFHALNVTVLSLMMGAEMGLKHQAMHALGIGALFHDLGKGRMPATSLKGGQMQLKMAIQKYYRHHPTVGAKLVAELPAVPRAALPVILQHHECMDGSGFPQGRKESQIYPLARIVHVANRYDNLLSQGGQTDELTEEEGGVIPHLAIKRLFNRSRHKLDERCLNTFIKALGIYPPGSIVQLNNGLYGMVVSTNPKKATRPSVLVYHHEVPRLEALIIDLGIEDKLEISSCMKPEDLPREVFKYLAPSRQVSYYADAVPQS